MYRATVQLVRAESSSRHTDGRGEDASAGVRRYCRCEHERLPEAHGSVGRCSSCVGSQGDLGTQSGRRSVHVDQNETTKNVLRVGCSAWDRANDCLYVNIELVETTATTKVSSAATSKRHHTASVLQQAACSFSSSGCACCPTGIRVASKDWKKTETKMVELLGRSCCQTGVRLLEQCGFLHTRSRWVDVLLRDGHADSDFARGGCHRAPAQARAFRPGCHGGGYGLSRVFRSSSLEERTGHMSCVLNSCTHSQTMSSAHCCELPRFGFAVRKMYQDESWLFSGCISTRVHWNPGMMLNHSVCRNHPQTGCGKSRTGPR